MSLNSAGLRDEPRRNEESRAPVEASSGNPAAALATIQAEARQRLGIEFRDVRTALTDCYDQAVERLGDDQWVPLDLVTQLVSKLSEELAAERARVNDLSPALESARKQVQRTREECQAVIDSTRAAADQERKDTAARFAQELTAAREAAKSAGAAQAHVRSELSAVRNRCQEIVDSQMLQLVKFKRELEPGTPQTDQAIVDEIVPSRDINHLAVQAKPVVAAAPPRVDRNRSGAPAFDAIEAALADSPPLGKWPPRASV